jgi:hypothetical protein
MLGGEKIRTTDIWLKEDIQCGISVLTRIGNTGIEHKVLIGSSVLLTSLTLSCLMELYAVLLGYPWVSMSVFPKREINE